MRPLFIDARLLFASGIGRYLREIVCRWPAPGADRETFLCRDAAQADWLRAHRPGASVQPYPAEIYSLREQALALTLPRHAVLWVPHYNLPWLTPARVVATVHDVAPLALPDIFARPAQRAAARFYFGAARWTARHVITVSHFSAGELQRRLGLPARRISVVPNGVGPEWFTAAAPRHTHRLLFVGNLKPHKNLARLLAVIARARAAGGPPWELDVVGRIDGFRAGLEAATAERVRHTPWIRFHGPVPDAPLRDLYARAAALVFPSCYEGFGLPLLEALAAGCPVLAARGSALPEIGGTAGGVIYFDPRQEESLAAALARLAALPAAARAQLGDRGRARAAQFSWDATAAQTRALLAQACAAPGEAGAPVPVRPATLVSTDVPAH